MKYITLMAAVAFSVTAVAQKREIKKISSAIEDKDFKEAAAIFQEINENEVEEKYQTEYAFYKARIKLGPLDKIQAKGDELFSIMEQLQKAEKLGSTDAKKLQQNVTNAIISEAQDKLAAGDSEGALKNVKYLADLDPDNLSMRENVASLSYRLENYEAAKEGYEFLLSKGYTGVEESYLATNLANDSDVLFATMEEAEAATKTKIYANPRKEVSDSKLGPIISSLAWIYVQDGEMDKAKDLINSNIAKYPDDQSLETASADLYLLVGNTDMYEKKIAALKEDIKDPRVFENLGIAAADKQNWDQAIDYYLKSIELDSANYVTHNNIAVAYINKGNAEKVSAKDQTELYSQAVYHLEKVVELKPDLASAKQTLVGLYGFLKMTDKEAALKVKM